MGKKQEQVDALAELAALRNLRCQIDEVIVERVVTARQDGLSWTAIGRSLGVTRQSARQRFRAHLHAQRG